MKKLFIVLVLVLSAAGLFAQETPSRKTFQAYLMTYPVSTVFALLLDHGTIMIPLSLDLRFGDFPLCLTIKNDVFLNNTNSYSPGFKNTFQLGGRWQFSESGLTGWFVRGRGVLYFYYGLNAYSDHFPYFLTSPEWRVGYGFEMDAGYSWIFDNGLTLELSAGWQSSFVVYYNYLSPTAVVLNMGIGWAF